MGSEKIGAKRNETRKAYSQLYQGAEILLEIDKLFWTEKLLITDIT